MISDDQSVPCLRPGHRSSHPSIRCWNLLCLQDALPQKPEEEHGLFFKVMFGHIQILGEIRLIDMIVFFFFGGEVCGFLVVNLSHHGEPMST